MMFRVGVLASATGLLLLAACIQVAPTPEPTIPAPAAFVRAYAESLLSEFGVVKVDAPTRLTRDEALRLGREFLASQFRGAPGRPGPENPDQLQALLVRYTADPGYFEYGKLSWFLVAPPTMQLMPGRFSPGATGEPDRPQPMWWPAIVAVMLDDETGRFWGGSLGNMGPGAFYVTPSQLTALNSYAATYGWWPVWFQLHQYDHKPLPDSAILELKPPDQLLAN